MKISINQEVIKNVSNLVSLMIEKDPEIPEFIDHFDTIWLKDPEIPEFIDPFDSIWLKLLTGAVYIIGVFHLHLLVFPFVYQFNSNRYTGSSKFIICKWLAQKDHW